MKIQFCSDLHLEFAENRKYLKNNPIIPAGEILLLGGDIMLFSQMDHHRDFINFLSDHFQMTYWIPGNHEYYHGSIDERTGSFKEQLSKNVVLLNNKVIDAGEVEIVCSTLWSQISPLNAWNIQMNMSDFHLIKKSRKTISIGQYNILHTESLNFITTSLQNKIKVPRIVLTHHVPTFMNYPEQYRNDPLNEGFATELFKLIETSQIDYWIFGHHHRNISPFKIGSCSLETNQLGYVAHGENESFKHNKVLVV
ncbi:MAG: metallophosphoesterase [Bacteroidetes bacterium]|nr:metallophosphoesterase [Bacteroidota bacterium]